MKLSSRILFFLSNNKKKVTTHQEITFAMLGQWWMGYQPKLNIKYIPFYVLYKVYKV